jgi:hypothetical protein
VHHSESVRHPQPGEGQQQRDLAEKDIDPRSPPNCPRASKPQSQVASAGFYERTPVPYDPPLTSCISSHRSSTSSRVCATYKNGARRPEHGFRSAGTLHTSKRTFPRRSVTWPGRMRSRPRRSRSRPRHARTWFSCPRPHPRRTMTHIFRVGTHPRPARTYPRRAGTCLRPLGTLPR